MRITVWDSRRKVNHPGKVVWHRKIITEFARSISFTRIGKPALMMDVKFPKTNTFADGLIERTWSMLDEIESKNVYKEGDR